jgi:hypothetical protein
MGHVRSIPSPRSQDITDTPPPAERSLDAIKAENEALKRRVEELEARVADGELRRRVRVRPSE